MLGRIISNSMTLQTNVLIELVESNLLLPSLYLQVTITKLWITIEFAVNYRSSIAPCRYATETIHFMLSLIVHNVARHLSSAK